VRAKRVIKEWPRRFVDVFVFAVRYDADHRRLGDFGGFPTMPNPGRKFTRTEMPPGVAQ
jgi:hypothetical protein